MSDRETNSDHEDVQEDLKQTPEEIYARVTNTILEALKEFDPTRNHPGLIKTDQLKNFLGYCAFKMED